MEITRETPINFIVFNANIDKKNLYNGPIARMCMDSWKRAFPNLNIINIDVTEEITHINEFCEFCYSHNVKSFITDPLRLYYMNQYDNCVYCDYDVILYDFNSIIDLMNKKDCFIIQQTGTFIWNRYKNNKTLNLIVDKYNEIGIFCKKDYTNNVDIYNYLCKYAGDWYVFTLIDKSLLNTTLKYSIKHLIKFQYVTNCYLKIYLKYFNFMIIGYYLKMQKILQILPYKINNRKYSEDKYNYI